MNKTKKSTANKAANAVQNGYYDIYRLGEDPRCHVSTNSFETRLNNNVMVIGGSGAGKTTSVSLPMLLHSEYSNLVAIFTKRPLMMKVARYLKKKRNADCYGPGDGDADMRWDLWFLPQTNLYGELEPGGLLLRGKANYYLQHMEKAA